MKLTEEQSSALDKIMRWINNPSDKWMFILKGYAGTGKTTLMRHLIENHLGNNCWCCAPTGKAASVLQGKIKGVTVRTIHSLLYKVKPAGQDLQDKLMEAKVELEKDPDNPLKKELVFTLHRAIEQPSFDPKMDVEVQPNDVVIIDESSMLTPKMAADFRKTGARCIFVGDPGQLPPVGSDHWFEDQNADSMLETIQRQALDNPIIRLSMAVRNGLSLPDSCEEVVYAPRKSLGFDCYRDADQIITGTNNTRQGLNRWMRSELGFTKEHPEVNDKLICLRNNFEEGWINGVQCVATSDTEFNPYSNDPYIDLLYQGKSLVGTPYYPVPCEQHYKTDVEPWPYAVRQELFELDFAYAITTHKSQGSEWNTVLIADDRMKEKDALFRKRWLYTAITRAKEKVIWVSSQFGTC